MAFSAAGPGTLNTDRSGSASLFWDLILGVFYMNVYERGTQLQPRSKWRNLSETPSCQLRISFTTWLKSIHQKRLASSPTHCLSKWFCLKLLGQIQDSLFPSYSSHELSLIPNFREDPNDLNLIFLVEYIPQNI